MATSTINNKIEFVDYSNGEQVTAGLTSYTAPSNGIITGSASTNNGIDGRVYVNSHEVFRVRDQTGASNTNCFPYFMILRKGDVVTFSGNLTVNSTCYFYPFV